jgi:hypothetical protein
VHSTIKKDTMPDKEFNRYFKIDHSQKTLAECLGIDKESENIIRQTLKSLISEESNKNGISGVIDRILRTFHEPNEISFAIFVFGRWSAQAECPLHNGDFSILGEALRDAIGKDSDGEGPNIQVIKL